MPEAHAAEPEGAAVPPLAQLYFYLTEGCNLACRHCWLAPPFDPDVDKAPVLPVGLFEQAIAEAKPLGLTGVKLTGGEPLLHPRFAELLDIVEREQLALTIETNGTLLTPELAQRLGTIEEPGAPSVSVSLDGADAATHEAVRGVPGSFEKAVTAVRLLAQAGLRPQIIFTVMRANAGQLEKIVTLAHELDAGSVKFNVLQPTARGERLTSKEEALTVGEYIELGRRVDTELAAATDVDLFFDYPPAFRPLSRLAAPHGRGGCGILGILGVLAGGHYALCGIGQHVPELVFGAVGDGRLAAIWQDSESLAALRNGLPVDLGGICADCVMSGGCLGSCVAQNYYRSHDLFAPFWFCAAADNADLFPASRRRTAGDLAAREARPPAEKETPGR